MSLVKAVNSFPEIQTKDDSYYLFIGLISELTLEEIEFVMHGCLVGDIFKRKILIYHIEKNVSKWPIKIVDKVVDDVLLLITTLDSYFKKESASIVLSKLFVWSACSNKNIILKFLLRSQYKNNRKRAYDLLLNNWLNGFETEIGHAWNNFDDNKVIELIVKKMPLNFLLENFEKISEYFNDEDLNYDFQLKKLRNHFYLRVADTFESLINNLKESDPISYIFIMKERRKNIDPVYAIEIYKKFKQYRKFLPRWYAAMGLWCQIIKKDRDILKDILDKTPNRDRFPY